MRIHVLRPICNGGDYTQFFTSETKARRVANEMDREGEDCELTSCDALALCYRMQDREHRARLTIDQIAAGIRLAMDDLPEDHPARVSLYGTLKNAGLLSDVEHSPNEVYPGTG